MGNWLSTATCFAVVIKTALWPTAVRVTCGSTRRVILAYGPTAARYSINRPQFYL